MKNWHKNTESTFASEIVGERNVRSVYALLNKSVIFLEYINKSDIAIVTLSV